ncbi:MAG: hypothetical protein U0V48_14960 [Anaerolineales bacterium]
MQTINQRRRQPHNGGKTGFALLFFFHQTVKNGSAWIVEDFFTVNLLLRLTRAPRMDAIHL